jgi:hypothetical protein
VRLDRLAAWHLGLEDVVAQFFLNAVLEILVNFGAVDAERIPTHLELVMRKHRQPQLHRRLHGADGPPLTPGFLRQRHSTAVVRKL